MGLYSIKPCDKCGSDIWRQNAVTKDKTARVISYSCFKCGAVIARVLLLVPREQEAAEC